MVALRHKASLFTPPWILGTACEMVRGFQTIGETFNTGEFFTCFVFSRRGLTVKTKMKIAGSQIKAARDLLGVTQGELATAAGVGLNTINRFETGQVEPHRENLDKILAELERRGIEFTNGDGIGVKLHYAKAAEFAKATAQAPKEPAR